MERFIIGAILNKKTDDLVCKHYYNRPIKEIIDIIGQPLQIQYEDGSFFTHEKVIDHYQTDYGFWVETTSKNWRFDWL